MARSAAVNRALAGGLRLVGGTRARTSIGLFEQTSAGYGEIWYDIGGRKATGRSVTAEAVLETLYSIGGVTSPALDDESVFRGHPLVTHAPAAATVFYLLWPALVISAGIVVKG